MPTIGDSVPETLQVLARAACMKAWDGSINAAVRIFALHLATGTVVNLNPPNFWYPEPNGHYSSGGFNADPGVDVIAKAGLWDEFYNQRQISKITEFEYLGKDIGADCNVAPETSAVYPNL